MKRHLKDAIMQHRERGIIKFIKENPFCTKDSIFTKNNIPKSSATNELIKKLIFQKKIKTTSMKRRRFYVKEIEFLSRLEILAKDYAHENRNNPDNFLDKVSSDFLKFRLKVLRAEQKYDSNIDLRETLSVLENMLEYHKKPNLINHTKVFVRTVNAVVNDKYYLKHQLKSQPKNTRKIFQKVKTRNLRRSLPELMEMKERDRREFGLTKKDYDKNLKKLTDDPWKWLKRFNAESSRTLYPKTLGYQPELIEKMFKKLGKKNGKRGNNQHKENINNSNEQKPLEKLNKNAMRELSQIMRIKIKN